MFRVPRCCQPDIACKDECVDGAAFSIVHVGQRADSLLVLENVNAGGRLGLAAQAEARHHDLRAGAP